MASASQSSAAKMTPIGSKRPVLADGPTTWVADEVRRSASVLTDEKILITGPAGQIAAPLCEYLAPNNDVWGIARFSVPGSRDEIDALGVTTRVVDLADAQLDELPDDFTYA